MANFNLPKSHLPHTSLPHPLTSSQLPFPGGSLWRSLAGSTEYMKEETLHHSPWSRFFCHWKCLPTSHGPYKLLPSKARNPAFVPDDPTGQSTFSQQEKVLYVQFCQCPWQHCTPWAEPVGKPLQHSSP